MKHGTCQVCRQVFQICLDGTIRLHRPCPGSRKEPARGMWEMLVEFSPVTEAELQAYTGKPPRQIRKELVRWRAKGRASEIDGMWVST